uniref:Extended FMRFamide-9 n=1 Tax=Mantophasma kudubergense TaxID=1037657 RepID=FAR9_MANKU|nr:RecName: Full=Extended FMRFamide-9; Short=FMRFa-9 [Mantophasma kudubergense]
GRGGSSNYVRL